MLQCGHSGGTSVACTSASSSRSARKFIFIGMERRRPSAAQMSKRANRPDVETGESDGGDVENGEYDESSSSTTGIPGFAIVIALVVIAVIIASNLFGSGGKSNADQGDTFPIHNSARWPAGATRTAILAPIAERLATCAQEPLLSPVNCPQSQSASGALNVRWTLDGNSTDGARIVYVDKQFEMAGNFVMSVRFMDDGGGDELGIDMVHYQAWVDWNSGSPILTSIIPFEGGAPPSTTKHVPRIGLADLQMAVLAAFRKCVSSNMAPLPPQCPTTSDSEIAGSHARWQLDNNPVLNAQEAFNKHWGFFEVSGTFSMSAKYSVFLLGQQQGIENGNYDAFVTLNGSNLYVVQIVSQ